MYQFAGAPPPRGCLHQKSRCNPRWNPRWRVPPRWRWRWSLGGTLHQAAEISGRSLGNPGGALSPLGKELDIFKTG